jgi:hypothetical protein
LAPLLPETLPREAPPPVLPVWSSEPGCPAPAAAAFCALVWPLLGNDTGPFVTPLPCEPALVEPLVLLRLVLVWPTERDCCGAGVALSAVAEPLVKGTDPFAALLPCKLVEPLVLLRLVLVWSIERDCCGAGVALSGVAEPPLSKDAAPLPPLLPELEPGEPLPVLRALVWSDGFDC